MTYGQIHTLLHLLGQWQDTNIFDPQRLCGSWAPMFSGHGWKCWPACTFLSCTKTLPNKQNNKATLGSNVFLYSRAPEQGEELAGAAQVPLGGRRASLMVVVGQAWWCAQLSPSNFQCLSLDHTAVQGCPKSKLLCFDLFVEREKRK